MDPSSASAVIVPATRHDGALDVAERASEIALGLVCLALGAVATAVADARRRPLEVPGPGQAVRPVPLPALAGAAFEVALATGRAGGRAVSMFARGIRPMMSFATGAIDGPIFQLAREPVLRLDERWREGRSEHERVASAFARSVVGGVADATLDQLDLTQLVLDRVDLERIVDRVDVDAIASRIDIDAIVQRMDLDGVVDRVDVQRVVGRVDIEGIVRSLDLAAIAQEVIDQLDLAAIATDVIQEVDVPQIVRDASGTMTDETIEAIRVHGVGADRALSRFVDRLFGRDGERGMTTEDRA
jgi:hypothetical protein